MARQVATHTCLAHAPKPYQPTVALTVDAKEDKGRPGSGRLRHRKTSTGPARKLTKRTRLGKPMPHPLQFEAESAAAAMRVQDRVEREIKALLESEVGRVAEPLTEAQAAALRTKLRARLAGILDEREQTAASDVLLKRVAAWNRRQFQRAVGIDVPEFSTSLGKRWVRQSVASIRGIAEGAGQRVESLILRSVTRGLRGSAFADELQRQLGLSRTKARDAAIGQVIRLHGKLTEHRQVKAGIVEYMWRTAGDYHVRHWHKKLNGTVQRWDTPPMGGGGGPHDRGHPSSADKCRCQPIAVIPIFQAAA